MTSVSKFIVIYNNLYANITIYIHYMPRSIRVGNRSVGIPAREANKHRSVGIPARETNKHRQECLCSFKPAA